MADTMPGMFSMNCQISMPAELCDSLELGGAACIKADDNGALQAVIVTWGKDNSGEASGEMPEGMVAGVMAGAGIGQAWEHMSAGCSSAGCAGGPSSTALCADEFNAESYWNENVAVEGCFGDAACMEGAQAAMEESCAKAEGGPWSLAAMGDEGADAGWIAWSRAADFTNDHVGAWAVGTEVTFMAAGMAGMGDPKGDDFQLVAAFASNFVGITMADGAAALTAGAAFLGYLAL